MQACRKDESIRTRSTSRKMYGTDILLYVQRTHNTHRICVPSPALSRMWQLQLSCVRSGIEARNVRSALLHFAQDKRVNDIN